MVKLIVINNYGQFCHLIHRAVQARSGLLDGPDDVLEALLPAERTAPIVTVIDGHPHTLSFLGAGVPPGIL